MKDYVKPYIREKNPDCVILHVGTNKLNSINVAKNIQSDSRIVSIPGTVPRNFNIKAMELNREFSKMCDKE